MTELTKLNLLKVGDSIKLKCYMGNCKQNAIVIITEINNPCNHPNCDRIIESCTGKSIQFNGANSLRCLSTKWFEAVTKRKKKVVRAKTRLEDLIL